MRRVSLMLFVPTLIVIAVGCNKAPQGGPPPKPPEVVVERAISKDVTDFEEFTGRTEAKETVEVRAHYTGYLDKVLFEEGAEVKKGQVLCEIDPRIADAQVKQAEAQVKKAAADTVASQARVTRLEADYQRISKLPRDSVSTSEFDKTVGDLSEARASLNSTAAAEKAADSFLKAAQVTLDYTKVISPISGRISRRFVDPGNTVKADETSLTIIVSLDPMYVYFDVDERTYRTLQTFLEKKGGKVELPVFMGLVDEKDFPHEGRVNFVDNRVDPNTGSVWVRGVFDNKEKKLTPGLFARVNLPIGEPHKAVLIPEKALGTDQGQKFVYVLNDKNEAIYRRVEFGAQHGQHRAILKGVEPGDRVIVSGLQRVRQGAPVTPKEEGAAKAEEKKSSDSK
jgi:RND family efflux transporter MFP subunit